jgi:hypothetical protein
LGNFCAFAGALNASIAAARVANSFIIMAFSSGATVLHSQCDPVNSTVRRRTAFFTDVSVAPSCRLSGLKRTSKFESVTFAFDPKRTWGVHRSNQSNGRLLRWARVNPRYLVHQANRPMAHLGIHDLGKF